MHFSSQQQQQKRRYEIQLRKNACAVLSVFLLRFFFYKNMQLHNASSFLFFPLWIYTYILSISFNGIVSIRTQCEWPWCYKTHFSYASPTERPKPKCIGPHNVYIYKYMRRVEASTSGAYNLDRGRLDYAPLLFGPRTRCLRPANAGRHWPVIHSDLTHTVWESIRFRINSVHWIIYAKLHNSWDPFMSLSSFKRPFVLHVVCLFVRFSSPRAPSLTFWCVAAAAV